MLHVTEIVSSGTRLNDSGQHRSEYQTLSKTSHPVR